MIAKLMQAVERIRTGIFGVWIVTCVGLVITVRKVEEIIERIAVPFGPRMVVASDLNDLSHGDLAVWFVEEEPEDPMTDEELEWLSEMSVADLSDKYDISAGKARRWKETAEIKVD